MNDIASKKCLILSSGPVPTPEHNTVEGGGLRCWGLAKGIASHNNTDVTVAYFDSYKKPDFFTDNFEGISIRTWTLESIPELLNEFDTIIVSYCMGDLSVKVADSIRPDQQLILDCYVPIYVEASARQTNDIDGEYNAFQGDVARFAHVLRRGDLFLCASKPQKRYYQGVISALGRMNPVTYNQDLILIVPYGIYREEPEQKNTPISDLIGKNADKYKKVLWFGGIYPWFDLNDLIDAIKIVDKDIPTKLIIVGAKNPFNNHPDFNRKYDELISYIDDNNLGDLVVIQEWIDFNDRANWYLDSDIVVVVNKKGIENELAWRTRLVDFTWANLPILTNAGDPLGDHLIEMSAASKLTSLESAGIAKDLRKLLQTPATLKAMQKQLSEIKSAFYWDIVTELLDAKIQTHDKSSDLTNYGMYDIVMPAATGSRGKIRKVVSKAKQIPAYRRKYGTQSTYFALRNIASQQMKKRLPGKLVNTDPKLVVISHQLDMSGAPFVLLDAMKALKQKYPEMSLDFYTFNPAHKINIADLNKLGIKPRILLSRESSPAFNSGDVVLLNTVGYSNQVKESLYENLQNGTIKKLVWYVHEDEPELIFSKEETKLISTLLESGKIEIVTAAVLTRDHYREHFGNKSAINIQNYQVVTPKKYHRKLKANDFKDKISFSLPGTMGDGRKGQLPIFYAFADFLKETYEKNPEDYRDFELVYIGMHDDFLSRQIERHAVKGLGKRFISYGRLTKEECMDIIMKSNATVCYSIRECLPLFVFEGMSAGHPILRNDCSGMEEQLVDGKNGYYLDSSDYEQVKQTLEKMLNRKKTPDLLLEQMSKKSYEISISQEKNSYLPMIETLREALGYAK